MIVPKETYGKTHGIKLRNTRVTTFQTSIGT
jgi:hypothetical protein